MKTREEILKDRYGFDKGSYKYVPRGGEILKYVGQYVVYVSYEKKDDTNWDTNFNRAFLKEISDFDPTNMTYLVKFRLEGDSEDREFRMIPEGYCWVESMDATFIERLLPSSMHCQLVEDDVFYQRLSGMWNNHDTLDFTALQGLASSKDKDSTLRYSRHLACIIRMNDGDTLYFRIHKLSLRHNAGNKYALSIWDGEDNPVKVLISPDMKSYPFESIGEFKIIDIVG